MLELRNIKFGYGGVGASFVIDIERARFQSSVITCVLGKNGSGKTTLLNLLGGHLQSDLGEIFFDGKEIGKLNAESRPTSTVFQQIGLFPHLSVCENIEIAIEPNSFFSKGPETRRRAQEVLQDFGLVELARRKPSQLSVGQQQRVAIARALSKEPKVLLLDEPTSSLDFFNIGSLKNILFAIKEKQSVPVVIIVSHDMHFVLETADHVKYIEQGKFIFEGTAGEFKKSSYNLIQLKHETIN